MISHTSKLYERSLNDFLAAQGIYSGTGNQNLILRLWYYILAKKQEHNIIFGVDSLTEPSPFDYDTAVSISQKITENQDEKSYPLIATYLSNKLKTAVVINDSKHQTENTGRILKISFDNHSVISRNERLAKLQENLILVLPKLFPNDIELSKNNISLIKQCEELLRDEGKSRDACYRLGNELIKDSLMSFIEEKNHDAIQSCLCYSQEFRKQELQRAVEVAAERCQQLLQDYNYAVQDYNDKNASYELIMVKNNDEDVSLLQAILFNNPNIVVQDMQHNTIDYVVQDKIVVFNKKDYENKVANEDIDKIAILQGVPDGDKKKMLQFLNSVFIDREYKIRTFNSFRLCLDNRCTLSLNKKNFDDKTMLGHPHGQSFGCTGTYSKEWNQALAANNLAAAIQYTVSYTCHINWNDFAVCNRMVSDIWRKRNDKFMEDNDGNLLSPAEIMARMEGEPCK